MSETLPVPSGGALHLPDRYIGGKHGVATTGLAEALSSAATYAQAEKADATRRAYRSDFEDFRTWCERRKLEQLPASPATVAAYIAVLADRGLKASTIARRIASIRFAHRLKGLDSPTDAEQVRAVLRGIRRSIGSAVARKAPATADAVRAMLRRIPRTLAGKRDRALLLIGFAAALRRSELVDLKVNALERVPEGLLVHIRRSKTDQMGEGHQVAVARGGKLKVIEALEEWLGACGITEGPIFRAIGKSGRISAEGLTGASVALIIKKHCGPAGLDPEIFSGHSLRAGFVTSALEDGADLLKVMDVTRHKNVQTLKVYDRRAQAFRKHAGAGFL
jgi:site-specific recombinase XerD